ncbi:cytochrome c551 [Salibacterium salarium]|uniref:c-type cytochrome n=1 Tax=Salibacterium salarium TaxID=284579 RepID=UPI0027893E21|nr:cytochrome c [Salibacterium salarium]MDQ0298269.1 cytochrome c551 [Salibacterium salarium]
MKKAMLAFAGSAMLILGACGGGGEDEAGDSGADNGGGNGGGKSYDAEAAQESYDSNCLQCHGENLEGQVGPELSGNDLSKDEVLSMIQNGGNGMQANIIEGEEAENVAAWIADQ